MPSEPTDASPLGPKVHLSPIPEPTPIRVSARVGWGSLFLLAALILGVTAQQLLHTSATVAWTATPLEYDDSPVDGPSAVVGAGDVDTDIRCVPVVGGTEGRVEGDVAEGEIHEYRGPLGADLERGLMPGEIAGLCDQARMARVGHAGEAGFASLLLLAGGIAILRRRRAKA